MEYEPPNYVCTTCGLVINRFEFDKTKRKHFGSRRRDEEDPETEHRRKNAEYLDWYLSSDKKKHEDED
jgi:transcription initiation factor TFIIIB Brf1 subunit/transcription initiation factor TFIIB